MQKIFLKTLVLISIISFIFPLFASADGMAIWPDYDRWRFRDEESQTAFINYQDGVEKMIISTNLKQDTGNGVWLFPVPAKPEKVVIDVVSQTPNWSGYLVQDQAKDSLNDVRSYLFWTQIYPNIFIPRRIGYVTNAPIETNSVRSVGLDGEVGGITVYEHLEKEGMTTEIITAQTGNGLYNYLKNKSLNVEEGSIPVLNNYIGKDFTFVVSWISEKEVTETDIIPSYYYPTKKYQRGIFVAFPSEKIYYPLMPTSVYESKVVPATVYINGFVKPIVFKDIKPYTKVQYFMDNYIYNGEPQIFYGNNSSMKEFTRIEINSPSKLLSEDLFIKNSAPASTLYGFFIADHPIFTFVVLLIILSLIAGAISGLIVFKEARSGRDWLKFALLGLFNIVTIIGLIIATIFTPTKSIKAEDKDLFFEFKKRGYNTRFFRTTDSRKIVFLVAFSLLFTLISFASVALLGILI